MLRSTVSVGVDIVLVYETPPGRGSVKLTEGSMNNADAALVGGGVNHEIKTLGLRRISEYCRRHLRLVDRTMFQYASTRSAQLSRCRTDSSH